MNAHKTCVYQLNQNYPRPPHGRVYLLLGALSVEVLLAFTVGLAVLCGALPYTAAVATTVATVVGGSSLGGDGAGLSQKGAMDICHCRVHRPCCKQAPSHKTQELH